MSTTRTPRKRPPDITITHEFVEFVPDELAPNTLYVSIPFATAAHSCFCGCGNKVVTPIHPTGWQLHFDGDSVSLEPSIGNWRFVCRSHYFIRKNRIEWAASMTEEEIERGRRHDRRLVEDYFGDAPSTGAHPPASTPAAPPSRSWLARLVTWRPW